MIHVSYLSLVGNDFDLDKLLSFNSLVYVARI